MANDSNSSSSIGFFVLLTVLFIGLKLGGIINWSWWLVLAPVLAGPLVGALLIAACAIYLVVKGWFDAL